MQRLLLYRVIIVFLCVSLLAGCNKNIADPTGSGKDTTSTNVSEGTAKDVPQQANQLTTGKITIWGYYDGWKAVQSDFEKAHPGITLDFAKESYSNEELLAAIATGTAPDIVKIDDAQMSQFNSLEALDDLYQSPYNAKDISEKFPKHQLSWTSSVDGKKLYALPITPNPGVTFYREDILKQYGFPSEPEELAKYIENPDNWISMARELKKHDKWIMEWDRSPVDIYSMGTRFFDQNLNFIRNTAAHGKMLSVAKIISKEKLSPGIGIWGPSGQEMLRNGRMVMFYIGRWGEEVLSNSWAPETKGKWKATRLPFGAYGTFGCNSIAITKTSKFKKLAWDYINLIVVEDRNHFDNEFVKTKSEFLGGQESGKLYKELREFIPLTYSTPIDKKVEDMWRLATDEYINNASSVSEDGLEEIKAVEKKIEDAISEEKKIFQKTLEENK